MSAELSFYFQDDEKRSSPDDFLEPVHIAKATSDALFHYYNDDTTDKSYALDEFREETLPFFEKVKNGAIFYFDAGSWGKDLKKGEIAYLMRRGEQSSRRLNPEDRLYFDFARSTIGMLPDAVSEITDDPDKVRGLLHAPTSFYGTLKRVEEMDTVARRMVSGQYSPRTPISLHPDIVRTIFFFRTAGDFSRYCDSSPRIMKQYVDENAARLTDGIALNTAAGETYYGFFSPDALNKYNKDAARLLKGIDINLE